MGSFSPDIPFTVRVNILMVPLFVCCGYLRQGDQADAQTLVILFLNEAFLKARELISGSRWSPWSSCQ